MERGRWKKLKADYVLDNAWVRVAKTAYRLPGGREIDDFYIIERPDYAVTFATDAGGNIPMVRQYRAGADRFTLELPSGFIDEGESPESAAIRELEEESGVIAVEGVEKMAVLFVDPSNMAQRAHVFFARNVVKGGRPKRTSQERCETVWTDARTLAAWLQEPEERNIGMTAAAACLMGLNRIKAGNA